MNVDHQLGVKELQETILTLNLSVAQIDHSMTEGDNSVMALIESFNYLAKKVDSLRTAVSVLDPHDPEASSSLIPLIQADSAELSQKVTSAIIAFQFYDRLSQRLSHVSNGLSFLADIVSNEMQVEDTSSWDELKKRISNDISMVEEAKLFDLIFNQKKPAREAIEIVKQDILERSNTPQPQEEDDIDLF